MQYKITLTDTGKKKVYVNPGVREGIYLYPGEIKKLRLEDGSELEQDSSSVRFAKSKAQGNRYFSKKR